MEVEGQPIENEDTGDIKALSTAADVDPPIKKERIIFKGECKPLSELKDDYKGRIVQIIDRGSSANRLPGLAVLRDWLPSYAGRNYVAISLLDTYKGFIQRTYDMPLTTTMNVLSGRMGREIQAQLLAWEKANISKAIMPIFTTMGADPEVFIIDKDGEVIPAWKFLGSKAYPTYSAPGTYGNNPLYWDGFQAEFTTHPHIACFGWLFDNIQNALVGLHKAAKGVNGKLSIASVLPVNQDTLADGDEKHVEFGCHPSYNAYGLSGISRSGRDVPIRFAGGHIHFGFDGQNTLLKKNPELLKNVVWHLDAILGVACVSLFEHWDNPVRREFYGLPGEYRLPPHGLEYRTLSNAWLAHPVIGNIVFELARRAFHAGMTGRNSWWEATEGEVLDCILRSDATVARAILERNKASFMGLISQKLANPDLLYKVFSRDMGETVKNPADIAGNWMLDGGWVAHCNYKGKQWATAQETVRTGGKLC